MSTLNSSFISMAQRMRNTGAETIRISIDASAHLRWKLCHHFSNLKRSHFNKEPRGCIFSCVWPFYEWAVSNLNRSCERTWKMWNFGIFSHKSLTENWVMNEVCRTKFFEKILFPAHYIDVNGKFIIWCRSLCFFPVSKFPKFV